MRDQVIWNAVCEHGNISLEKILKCTREIHLIHLLAVCIHPMGRKKVVGCISLLLGGKGCHPTDGMDPTRGFFPTFTIL